MLNQAFLFAVLEERLNKIYQGNIVVLDQIQYFKLKNIRTIIVVGQQFHTKFTEYATYHRVDDNTGEAIDIFERTSQLIQNEIKRSSVLVCCQNGLNWSTAILIAYLISVKKWQYEKAFYHIKSLKYVVNPSLALKKQLILFNTKVHNVKNYNQENKITQSYLIVPSKFQQRIIEQNQKLQYLEDSIHSREERNSTSSNQLDKTPMFYSPKNQNNNYNNNSSNSNSKKKLSVVQSDKKIIKKQSITKLVRQLRNYTFQIDDGNINNNNNFNNNNSNNINIIKQNVNNYFINQPLIRNSPKFKDEESPIIKPTRRRFAHRTKSTING